MQPTTINDVTYMPHTTTAVSYSNTCDNCSWCVPTLVSQSPHYPLHSQMQYMDMIPGFENSMVLLMHGVGNMTLEVGCRFQVEYADPLSTSTLPSCTCGFHITLASGEWTRDDCDCLAPMQQWAPLPPLSANVIVHDIARHTIA